MSFTGPILLALALNCGHAPAAATPEMFPGIRIDLAAKSIDFDAQVSPMLVKDDRAPLFFLEVIACAPNTREHETLLISTVRPSHIHAAMLLIGLTPGEPGKWSAGPGSPPTLISTPPTGDRVTVRISYTDKDGKTIEADPLDCITSAKNQTRFIDAERTIAQTAKLPPPGWVFAGSKFIKRKPPGSPPDAQSQDFYDADGSGTIIGLTTFGSEVVAWSRIISPDAATAEPEWIADFTKTPPAETKVKVRIRKAE